MTCWRSRTDPALLRLYRKAHGAIVKGIALQLVKRVHEFYEELGREEVQAVNDMEQAARKDKATK